MCNWIRVKTIFEKIPIRLLVSTSLTSVYCKQFVCTSMTTGKKPSSTQHTQNLTLIFFPYELKMKLHYYSILYTIISWVYDKSKLCLSIHTYLFWRLDLQSSFVLNVIFHDSCTDKKNVFLFLLSRHLWKIQFIPKLGFLRTTQRENSAVMSVGSGSHVSNECRQ